MKTHAFRLHPGQYLREGIDEFVKEKNIQAGIILTCVGNLQKAIIRMADVEVIKTYEGSFEIVSLVGTLKAGDSHLHISISDKKGNTLGGHLKQGSIVGTTAEIVIGELEYLSFKIEYDQETGYDELTIEAKTENHI